MRRKPVFLMAESVGFEGDFPAPAITYFRHNGRNAAFGTRTRLFDHFPTDSRRLRKKEAQNG